MSSGSLKEAYTLAHTAQCRLSMEASRPERNLRFVVGHLMHYESLRLRIVEIEHDISKSQRAKAVAFKGTGHVDHRLQHKPSAGQLGRRSPPPVQEIEYASDEEDDDNDESDDDFSGEDDDAGDDLGLQRFPSGSSRPPQLIPDVEDDEDDGPISPPETLDQDVLENLIKSSEGSTDMANMYEGVRKCPCHHKTDSPSFERMWEIPQTEQDKKAGVTRAVAEVSV